MAADINVECINPFLIAATSIMRDMCHINVKVGKPYVKTTEFDENTVLIMIGVTGEMRGQVLLSFSLGNALKIASSMAMMEMTEMNELATSAISELGNMIMGNAATILSTKGIGIDITPPSFCHGSFSITTAYTRNVCIPLFSDEGTVMELDIAIKGEDQEQ